MNNFFKRNFINTFIQWTDSLSPLVFEIRYLPEDQNNPVHRLDEFMRIFFEVYDVRCQDCFIEGLA